MNFDTAICSVGQEQTILMVIFEETNSLRAQNRESYQSLLAVLHNLLLITPALSTEKKNGLQIMREGLIEHAGI